MWVQILPKTLYALPYISNPLSLTTTLDCLQCWQFQTSLGIDKPKNVVSIFQIHLIFLAENYEYSNYIILYIIFNIYNYMVSLHPIFIWMYPSYPPTLSPPLPPPFLLFFLLEFYDCTCKENDKSNTVSIRPDCPRITPFDLNVLLEAWENENCQFIYLKTTFIIIECRDFVTVSAVVLHMQ